MPHSYIYDNIIYRKVLIVTWNSATWSWNC